jgi:uncharacterized protein YkwD
MRLRFRWTYVFLALWIIAFGIGVVLVPAISPLYLIPLALINALVVYIFAWGIAGIARRGAGRKAFGVLLILVLVGLAYQSSAALSNLSPQSIGNVYQQEASSPFSFLSNLFGQPGSPGTATQSTSTGQSESVTATYTSSDTSIYSTTPAIPIQSATTSQSTISFGVLANPNFVNGKANITYPSDYDLLVQYALALVNGDRNQNGLGNLTLSTIPSGQQHSDSMAYFGYFSHWDVQGYKPYMRYSLLGGTGAVAENAGMDYCTTSAPSDTSVYPTSCDVQTIENGIANSEYSMMHNDAACCKNGHRDNILDPQHNRISIGIAINEQTSAIYFTEDFEDNYIKFSQPIYQGGTVNLVGTTSTSLSVSQLVIYYDPTPQPMTVAQLDATFSYDPGTFVGGVFPPCSSGCTYYPGAVSVYATQWQIGSDRINITFSMGKFVAADGSGVYTIYLLTGSSTGTSLTTYSFFD